MEKTQSQTASIGTLGIDGLREVEQRLESKSVYWVNIDDRETALAWALMLDLDANRPARLVIGERDADALREVSADRTRAFASYQLTLAQGQTNPFDDLTEGLPYWPLRDQTLVVVLPTDEAVALDEKRFAALLETLDEQARSRQAGILVMAYGHCSDRLRQRLFEHQMRLHGLIDIVGTLFHVRFWRTKALAVTDVVKRFEHDGHAWQPVTTENGEMVADDHHVVYAIESAWKREAHDEMVDLLPDNRAVFDKGINSAAATVVFQIRDMNEAAEVARMVHRLRTERGRYLKIVVCEAVPIRTAVEALILGCGANLMFQPEATFSFIRIWVNLLLGQRYDRYVHPSFDRVYEELMHMNNRGFIDTNDFIQQVRTVVTQRTDDLSSRGALVVLKPKSGMDAVETMMALQVARGGDIATVIDNRAVLFLYGCQSSYLKTVLKRIFAVMPTDLFESYIDIYDNETIEKTLTMLQEDQFESQMSDAYRAMFSYARERSEHLHGTQNRRLETFMSPNPVMPTLATGDRE